MSKKEENKKSKGISERKIQIHTTEPPCSKGPSGKTLV